MLTNSIGRSYAGDWKLDENTFLVLKDQADASRLRYR